MAETLSKKKFADLIGCTPQYVTKLLQADRLVMTGSSRTARVRVAESLARIDATADPNRDDVKARHAANRANAKNNGGEPPPADANSYSASRALKEHYAAQTARLEFEERAGTLCRVEDVRHAAANAGTSLRAALERLPDQLAPTLATISDEDQIRSLLVEHIEALLHDLAEHLGTLGQGLP